MYEEIHARVVALTGQISPERLMQKGTMSWYGVERSLNDVIIGFSNHIKRHCDEIVAFRKR